MKRTLKRKDPIRFLLYQSSREGNILLKPKSRGVVASPYKAIDTPISHIWPYPTPFIGRHKNSKIKKKIKK